ncbi:MAG: hypothetical protein PVH29_12710 [Candidatus Zixiibacteriota bacterium]|jgi:hypothetical protein
MAEAEKDDKLKAIAEQIEKRKDVYEKALEKLDRFSDIGPEFYEFEINR